MIKIFSSNSTGMDSLFCYCQQKQLEQIVASFIKERKEYREFKDMHELGYVR